MVQNKLQIDQWVWGAETIIWGSHPSHKYTFKLLAPKIGRPGCLSLQYHHEKSESWVQYAGRSWILLIVDGVVCTRIMNPGDVQNLETGVIHRLMGLTSDCKVLEPSTPDRHAADKSAPKDVVRLHCVLGREVSAPRNAAEAALVQTAIEYTQEAIEAIENGRMPTERNVEKLLQHGGFQI